MIRLLIVDDSDTVAAILNNIFSSDPEIKVVGRARNGEEGVALARSLKPDIITMDILMPIMDGVETTKIIMQERPVPILVISSATGRKSEINYAFDAINAGAVDIVEKPYGNTFLSYREIGEELIKRVKNIARIRAVRRVYIEKKATVHKKEISPYTRNNRLIAIGASTGGPSAINTILKRIDKDFTFPILIVQHISKGFIGCFADWLRKENRLNIEIAKDGAKIVPGVVYLSPDDYHMGLRSKDTIRLNKSMPCNGHRPSVDFLMQSVAKNIGKNSIGILLTGMGSDGAVGMQAIKKAGGKTIAQDKKSSVVFGMPQRAIELGAVDRVCPLEDIFVTLISVLRYDRCDFE